MATLLVVTGRDRGSYYPLGSDVVIVGRDDTCDIQIVDDMISRRHVQISCKGEEENRTFFVADLQSANGVFVNDTRQVTEDTPLHDGDTIRIGESKLFFSTKRFPNLDAAMGYFKQRGQRGKSTIVRQESRKETS